MSLSDQTVITIDYREDVSPDEREAIWSWLLTFFPGDDDELMPVEDWYVRVWQDDQWVSMVEIYDHEITVGGMPMRVGGIGGLATDPAYRNRGYASAAMRRAAQFMFDSLQMDSALLVCDDHRIPFYQRLGWQPISAPVYSETNAGRTLFSGNTLVLLREGIEWPEGEVDLQGAMW